MTTLPIVVEEPADLTLGDVDWRPKGAVTGVKD
jgi:hypothetical protein